MKLKCDGEIFISEHIRSPPPPPSHWRSGNTIIEPIYLRSKINSSYLEICASCMTRGAFIKTGKLRKRHFWKHVGRQEKKQERGGVEGSVTCARTRRHMQPQDGPFRQGWEGWQQVVAMEMKLNAEDDEESIWPTHGNDARGFGRPPGSCSPTALSLFFFILPRIYLFSNMQEMHFVQTRNLSLRKCVIPTEVVWLRP